MKPLPEAVTSFLAAATVCRIASVKADGSPHVIPVCPAFDGDATVYVDVTKGGVTAGALAGNDRITAIFDEYYDDWSKLKAVILRCRAEVLHGSELDAAWNLLRQKYPQGQAIGWEARHTLALRIGNWTEWGIAHPLGYQPE